MPVKYIKPVKKTDALALICDGKEHRLDVGDYAPTLGTLMFADTYLNFDEADLKSAEPGRVEVWMRRAAWNGEPADDTFFTGFWLHREGYSHKDSRATFEWCEKDRPCRWYYKTSGLYKVNLGTRFVKYALVS
jgi:hypothetical protein